MSELCFTQCRQMLKTSFDVFSLRQEHVWTCLILADRICEMRRATESGQQPKIIFAVLRPLVDPALTWN